MSETSSLESLEHRLLYALTPSDPRPNTLGKTFDITERQALFARLSSLPAGTYNTLKANLQASDVGSFDTNLLAYMRSRTSAKFFFQPGSADSIASYVNSNLSIASQTQKANWITDSRLFPEQSAVDSYSIVLPANVNWSDATPSSNPEFISALNRHEWWVDLAQSYQYTGDAKYMNELLYELSDWSYENPAFTLPAKKNQWASYGFDVSIRVENWLMAYYSVLGEAAWTGAANSLMLFKLTQQGDVLNSVSANLSDYANNRTISIGRSTMFLGELLPELNTGDAWEARGRAVVYASMDGQLYDDGSHREQSPGYAVNVVDDLLEARRLDAVNGVSWDQKYLDKLEDAVDAVWQQLSPNSNRPAIGDTYRISASTIFLKAALTLGETKWPEAKPRPRDAWLFGTAAINPYLGNSVTPALGSRGDTYEMEDSGNYVIRSGSDANARQINFKAGPKGGLHGHYDNLSFELFGYGRPLIADPGAYIYNTDSKRNWAVSTKAHNTIGVADLNHGDLPDNASVLVSDITNVAGGYMIGAGHQGYQFLAGAPTVYRSIWYDGDDTMVVVDFAETTTKQNFETGFTLENQNTGRNLEQGYIYTKNTDGLGNVRVQTLLRPGQSAYAATSNIFTTSDTPPNHIDPATHYFVQQLGTTFAVFAHVITAYSGNTASNPINTAAWKTVPTKFGQGAVITVNGTDIAFNPPRFDRPNAIGETRGTFNDVAYDSNGRLHSVYYDRDTRSLKYAVRDTNGVWSTVQTIDNSGDYMGYNPSLAIDKYNRPGVAYQDANNGDLRYAYLSPTTNAWDVQVVDVPGSTGGYPNLIFTRNNTPAIAYYNKTKGDLRLALADTAGWVIQTIDSKGDVGRFPSIQLDPNRPTASKFAIAYEDTTNADVKWGIQYQTGWRFETVDKTMTTAGGYISMKFYDSGVAGDSRYRGVATYYDAGKGQLRYAYDTGGVEIVNWTSQVIASKKRQGLYSKLDVTGNKPRVFFFDGTNNKALYLTSTKVIGGKWSLADLGSGGREIHYAAYKGAYMFTSLDESTGSLTVKGL